MCPLINESERIIAYIFKKNWVFWWRTLGLYSLSWHQREEQQTKDLTLHFSLLAEKHSTQTDLLHGRGQWLFTCRPALIHNNVWCILSYTGLCLFENVDPMKYYIRLRHHIVLHEIFKQTLHHIYCMLFCFDSVWSCDSLVLDACCEQALRIFIKNDSCNNMSARFLWMNF